MQGGAAGGAAGRAGTGTGAAPRGAGGSVREASRCVPHGKTPRLRCGPCSSPQPPGRGQTGAGADEGALPGGLSQALHGGGRGGILTARGVTFVSSCSSDPRDTEAGPGGTPPRETPAVLLLFSPWVLGRHRGLAHRLRPGPGRCGLAASQLWNGSEHRSDGGHPSPAPSWKFLLTCPKQEKKPASRG